MELLQEGPFGTVAFYPYLCPNDSDNGEESMSERSPVMRASLASLVRLYRYMFVYNHKGASYRWIGGFENPMRGASCHNY